MSGNRRSLCILAIAVSAALAACASELITVAPEAPQQYSRLGKATGSACGSLGILTPELYFIPMGAHSRIKKAYDNAVASVPGATALVDVTIQEDWTWWVIGTARCVTISGEAIK